MLAAKHYLCVFDRAEDVANLAPDIAVIATLDLPAVIVTAPSAGDADFVSRFFAPANGVPEDPVSGVAHLCLAPYWAKRLGTKNLIGRQLSRRGGVVRCQDLGSRIRLSGSAIIVLTGHITFWLCRVGELVPARGTMSAAHGRRHLRYLRLIRSGADRCNNVNSRIEAHKRVYLWPSEP